MKKILICLLIVLYTFTAYSYPVNDKMKEFIDMMKSKYNADEERLYYIFERVEYRPEVIENMDAQFEASEWKSYKSAFIKSSKINGGVAYFHKHRKTLLYAEKKYGVKAEIIAAIIGVETNYGEYPLPYRAVDAISTLAFDYPRRSGYFMKQLEHLFLYCTYNRINIFTVKGSFAGAVGIPQFMPENIAKYGVDMDRNNKKDIVNSHIDAIGSVANYLKNHGWVKNELIASETVVKSSGYENINDGKFYKVSTIKKFGIKFPGFVKNKHKGRILVFGEGEDKEVWAVFKNFDVIKQYNNSDKYAMAVTLLAYEIRSGIRR